MSRPYGVSILIGGVDSDGPSLYHLEASGAFSKVKAKSVGAASDRVNEILEAGGYDDDKWTLRETKKKVLSMLRGVMSSPITAKNVELAVITPTVDEKGRRTGVISYVQKQELEAIIAELNA
jgi:20S proteasome alpha/beta subunit